MSLKYTIRDTQGFFRRNAMTIASSIIALCILGIFVLQAMTIASLSRQVALQNQALTETKKQTETIAKNASTRTKQINDLNRHLDCIVFFFSQPNRTSKSIQDIDTCRITGVFTNATTSTQSHQTTRSATTSRSTEQTQTSQSQATFTPPTSITTTPLQGTVQEQTGQTNRSDKLTCVSLAGLTNICL